jgi:hypothetical protein
MVLWDGSPHRWFGPDHSPCCLMAAIDDATGAILAARFFSLKDRKLSLAAGSDPIWNSDLHLPGSPWIP